MAEKKSRTVSPTVKAAEKKRTATKAPPKAPTKRKPKPPPVFADETPKLPAFSLETGASLGETPVRLLDEESLAAFREAAGWTVADAQEKAAADCLATYGTVPPALADEASYARYINALRMNLRNVVPAENVVNAAP